MLSATILTCLLLAALTLAAGRGTEIYVSPAGDDTNPGTKDRPLATPLGARAAVRKLTSSGLQAPVTVYLAGGTYELAEPLVLGAEDSGTALHAVTWSALPGASVTLSGGSRITGWAKGPGSLWQTTVPGVKEGRWYFRQLWVDGRRAVRARTPNAGANPSCLDLKGAELAKDLSTYKYVFPPGALKNWGNVSDVEAIVFGEWEITRKRFQSVDPNTGVAYMAGPQGEPHPSIAAAKDRRFFIENTFEALDEPGEWYLDRTTGVLSYWPRPGEDMSKAEAVAPRLTRLLEVKGAADAPVRNLHMRGLAFMHTGWTPPAGGYLGIQACHYSTGTGTANNDHGIIDSAILWNYAESCSLEDCDAAHLGGCAIELANRCSRNVLQGNRVFDVSGNGLALGGPKEEPNVPKDNRIANNLVYECGRDYPGAAGIWVGIAQRALIAHNELHDLTYTGISIGWQWDSEPTPARENVIEYNHVHDVMLRLSDGGGIYTLGLQPGSVIRGNHIHHVPRNPIAQGWPNNGLFLDEGTTGFTIEDNLIHDTVGTPMRFHKAGINIVRNNVLGVGKGGPIEYNATPAQNIKQENNTLVETGKELPATTIPKKAGLEEAFRPRSAASQPATK